MLHIGGARTALFNWLFARSTGGVFRLRIEDTDRERSTPEATEAILSGLRWLGLDWDGKVVSQHSRRARHVGAANDLLASGHAYKCFATAEEISEARKHSIAEGRPVLFESPWRDVDPDDHPDRSYTVRLKSPVSGSTTIQDIVCDKVSWKNETLDDMVIVRSDGNPTYNFAVVIDDHDMEITHVIRGDDHLMNSARQLLVYQAFGWQAPRFAHIPLIFDQDGRKLSKRTGDPGLDHYQQMGILPEAMRNYLARLGWSHGNDEYFSTELAIEWFTLEALGKSPSRLNHKKLLNLSRLHIDAVGDARLVDEIIAARGNVSPGKVELLTVAIPLIRRGVRTLRELSDKAEFLFSERPVIPSTDAAAALDGDGLSVLRELHDSLASIQWERDSMEGAARELCDSLEIKMGMLAQPVRAALAGSTVSPSIFDMMLVLGRRESLARMADVLPARDPSGR